MGAYLQSRTSHLFRSNLFFLFFLLVLGGTDKQAEEPENCTCLQQQEKEKVLLTNAQVKELDKEQHTYTERKKLRAKGSNKRCTKASPATFLTNEAQVPEVDSEMGRGWE